MMSQVFEGDPRRCYGCGACKQVCPVSAIAMRGDAEGFLFPEIDSLACIECGRCTASCPAADENTAGLYHARSESVYAAWSKSTDDAMDSASGAVFPALARSILDGGGIVYGCAWGAEAGQAEHVRIDKETDLWKLKKSKYVQSDTANTFNEVKTDLEDGKTVLYSGTGCQTAGLRLFLKKDYPNLYTVDIICHGVPSAKMLQAYLSYEEGRNGYKISQFNFRDKKRSGYRGYVSWHKPDGRKVFMLVGLSTYFVGFAKGYFNRESCYLCGFAQGRRVADITIGDYWGIESVHPELAATKKYGVSAVLCNTSNGGELLESAGNGLNLRMSAFALAAAHNRCLQYPEVRPALRDKTYTDLDAKGFKYLADTCLKQRGAWMYRLIPSWAVRLLKTIVGKK